MRALCEYSAALVLAAAGVIGTIILIVFYTPGPNAANGGKGDPVVFIPYALCFCLLCGILLFKNAIEHDN